MNLSTQSSFDGKGYYLMTGLIAADGAETWMPVFEAMAHSFRRVKQ